MKKCTIDFYKIIEENNFQELENLIKNKILDLNQTDEQNLSLLQLSIKYKSIECAKVLIQNGCNLNYQEPNSGHNAIHYSIRNKQIEIIQDLIDFKADFTIKTNNSYTTAHFAIKFLDPIKHNNLIKQIINLQSEENLNTKADNKYSIQDFFNMYHRQSNFELSNIQNLPNQHNLK